eukprot:326244_1
MTLLSHERAILLVFGYTHDLCYTLNIEIPVALIQSIVQWYYQPYKILRWSKKYCSKNSFVFKNDDTVAVRQCNLQTGAGFYGGHRYILADITPLYTGVHCFRAQTTMLKTGWTSWGVGEYTNIGDQSWDKNNSWNIAENHWSAGCNLCRYDDNAHKHFLDFTGIRL